MASAKSQSASMLMCIFLAISNIILIILCIMAIQQLCITNMSNNTRIRRTIAIIFFIVCCIILNSMVYITGIYSNCAWYGVQCEIFADSFEAYVIIIGCHIFLTFNTTLIDQLYAPMNMQKPKWIKISYIILEVFVIVMAAICYSLQIANVQIMGQIIRWIDIFHIILALVVLMCASIILWIRRNLLRLLNEARGDDQHINDAKRAMKNAICMALFVCIIMMIDTLAQLEIMDDFFGIQFDKTMVDCIGHSIFMIVLNTALILWVYKKNTWCIIFADSVCVECCCGALYAYGCDCCCGGAEALLQQDDEYNNYMHSSEHIRPILMKESTASYKVTSTPYDTVPKSSSIQQKVCVSNT